ncbi:MAG: hypothetical protein PUD55_06095 [Firmicutes bacterium]|nr:hypothetical protein [Bacillota bacterium]
MRKAGKIAKKVLGGAVAAYAGLFVVFYFDLDGKLLFHVVEPFLKNHYDKMERKDPLSMPYDIIDGDYVK